MERSYTLEVSDVIHSYWGFIRKDLDHDHFMKPVLMVRATEDRFGGCTSNWIVKNYRYAREKVIASGHLASLWHTDEIREEIG